MVSLTWLSLPAIVLANLAEQPVCRYPLHYDSDGLLNDPAQMASFIDDYLRGEAQYIYNIGHHEPSWFTLDGARLDVETGEMYFHHYWTASSKECLLFGILSLVLDGNARAQMFFTREEALQILATKIDAFWEFNDRFPGFGGHLPWMLLDEELVRPTVDGVKWTPSLDNGLMWWPMWVLSRQLVDIDADLASKYKDWVDMMVASSKTLFWDESIDGAIRTEAHTEDMTQNWNVNTYTGNVNCNPVPGPCHLDDPFEGEMFTMMMYLANENFTPEDREAMWAFKRAKLRRGSIRIPINRVGVWFEGQMGHLSTAHEQWKYMFLPYTDSVSNRRAFENTERIRTNFASAYRGKVGMWAAMTGTAWDNEMDPGYWGDCGMNEMSWVPSKHNHFVTPYAAFPMVLINETIGMVWVHNLIKGKKGTNCFGTTEGFDVTGYSVSPWVTWDTKITTAFSLMGGHAKLAAKYMKLEPWIADSTKTMYDAFVDIVEAEWSPLFGNPLPGESEDYGLPSESIPEDYLEDFTGCPLERSCDGTVTRPLASGALSLIGSGAAVWLLTVLGSF